MSSEMKNNLMSVSVSVEVNKKLMERLMGKCIEEVVNSCAALYTFSASECLSTLLAEPSKSQAKSAKSSKPLKVKTSKSFPLPFMREHVNEDGCNGIIFNHGLFTQCKNGRETETMCNTCSTENCGTLEARMSADFKDPKGRRPSSYIAVLRKLKLTQEQAIQEAGKVNIELNESHFVEQEKVVKVKAVKEPKIVKEKLIKEPKIVKEKVVKVKAVKEVVVKEPKVKAVKVPKEKVVKEKVVKEKVIKVKVVKEVVSKVAKEPKEKVVKEKAGRPKSTKKAIETVTVEDLFASLVAEEVDFCSDEETELQTVATVSRKEQELAAVKQVKADAAIEKAEAELEKAVAKEQKKSDAKAESKERNEMHSEEVEQKKVAAIEGKALAAAAAKELKEFAAAEKALATAADKELKAAALAEKTATLAADKEQKALALAADKEQKALLLAEKTAALLKEKEQKATAAAEARALDKELKAAALLKDKEQKAAALAEAKQLKTDALAAAKQLKADSAKPKTKTVVAAVAQKAVEEQPVKVSVKRMTIEGVEYLISAANVLYFVSTREEAGLWNPVTETIDELPEESDNEEVEDDYESDTN